MTETLTQLTQEEFIAKYRELRVNELNDRNKLPGPEVKLDEGEIERASRMRETYSQFYNPTGRKIALLSTMEGESYLFHNVEDVLKLDGAIIRKLEPYNGESYRVKKYSERSAEIDNERQQAIDDSDDLILVSSAICDVVFSPFVFKNVDSKDNTILFLPERDLTTICSQDRELVMARELKKAGKHISIITTNYRGDFYRFL